MNEINVKPSTPRILEELDRLHQSLEMLSEAVERHEERLKFVLVLPPSVPSTSIGNTSMDRSLRGEISGEEDNSSDLTKIIKDVRRKVVNVSDKIVSLGVRLEI